MRQVPINSSYLIVGNGRIATHLRYYLKQSLSSANLDTSLLNWNRKENNSDELKLLLAPNTIVLLCLPDQEIIPFCLEFKNNNSTFVHFSGALETDLALGFHPLMTFGFKIFDSEKYSQIPFIGTVEVDRFKSIFPSFKNDYFQISKNQKSFYHSLCVLSGNGTTLLWELVRKEFNNLNLPKEILNPYMTQVLQNILNDDAGRLTGPWYRGDRETINANLTGLKESNLKSLYNEFLDLTATRSSL